MSTVVRLSPLVVSHRTDKGLAPQPPWNKQSKVHFLSCRATPRDFTAVPLAVRLAVALQRTTLEHGGARRARCPRRRAAGAESSWKGEPLFPKFCDPNWYHSQSMFIISHSPRLTSQRLTRSCARALRRSPCSTCASVAARAHRTALAHGIHRVRSGAFLHGALLAFREHSCVSLCLS